MSHGDLGGERVVKSNLFDSVKSNLFDSVFRYDRHQAPHLRSTQENIFRAYLTQKELNYTSILPSSHLASLSHSLLKNLKILPFQEQQFGKRQGLRSAKSSWERYFKSFRDKMLSSEICIWDNVMILFFHENGRMW